MARSAVTTGAAARRFHGWLDAVNSADPARVAAFFAGSGTAAPSSPSHDLEHEMGFRRTGGLDLTETEADTGTVFTGLVRERGRGHFTRVTVEVEPDEPHGIVRFDVDDVSAPDGAAPRRMAEDEAVAAFANRLTVAAADGSFSGAVLIERNGETVLSGARGLRDRETNAPNTTGTADVPGPSAGRDEPRTVQDYVDLLGEPEPRSEPGTRWHYNNHGYNLLGLMIEQVTGRTYEEYVAEHVFKPAGMRDTSFTAAHPRLDHAIAYTRPSPGAGYEARREAPLYIGAPAGGAYSTTADIGRFAGALLGYRLLDSAHTALVTGGKVPVRGGHYGYGFVDHTLDGTRWFGHSGGTGGINGDLRIYPESGYVIVVLANLDPPAATAMTAFAGDRLPAG
ncbi:beta-lactamase family protein [Spirillospora sp. NBC_00431]